LRASIKKTAMAIHEKPSRMDPSDVVAYSELAKIYLKTGRREDALAQYRSLVQHYESLGMKDKASKVMAIMSRVEGEKVDREKKITALKPHMKLKRRGAPITGPLEGTIPEGSTRGKVKESYFDLGAALERAKPEAADHKEIEISEKAIGCGELINKLREIGNRDSIGSNFNYNMGVAYREFGFIDDAIEQFQIACEKRENLFESARSLGLCFKEKNMWAEASQAFEKALEEQGISQADTLAVKCELGLIFKEQGKTEEALELFMNNPAEDQRFLNAKEGANKGKKKSAKR